MSWEKVGTNNYQAEEQPFAKGSLHADGFLSIICASGDGFRFSFVVRNRKGSWI
jgi:hypothetical protein